MFTCRGVRLPYLIFYIMSFLDNVFGAVGDFFGEFTGVNESRRQQRREMAFNAEQAQLNRDFQREERLATQDYNMDMWNLANEYNSPSAQIERAQAAGINPNAFIGGNGYSSSVATPVSSSPMGGSQASSSGSIADSLMGLNPELANLTANTLKTLSEKNALDISNATAPTFNDAQIRKANAEVGQISASAGFTAEQTRQMRELFPLLQGKNIEEINKLQKETNVLIEQLSEIQSNVRRADADTSRIEAETERIEAETERIEAETDNTQEDTKIKKWEAEFRNKFNVSPNSGTVSSVIQLLLSGEKGANVARSLLNTTFGLAKGTLQGAVDNADSVYQQIKKVGKFSFMDLLNPFSSLPSIWFR